MNWRDDLTTEELERLITDPLCAKLAVKLDAAPRPRISTGDIAAKIQEWKRGKPTDE